MSAMPARCSRCSGWAPRSGPSTRCSSPTTPATATGPARSTPARRCASWSTASPRATCCGTATPCCPATWATPGSARPSCMRWPGCGRRTRSAIYCCDPVIGDVEEGVYVREGIEEFLRDHALPQADIATPNRFELERLTGLDLPYARRREGGGDAAGRHHASRRTALRAADQPGDRAHARRSSRSAGGRGGPVPSAAHAAPAGVGERRRRCDRRAVPVPSHQHRQRGRRAGGGGFRRARAAAPHRGGRIARDTRRWRRRTNSSRPPRASPRIPAECRSGPPAA